MITGDDAETIIGGEVGQAGLPDLGWAGLVELVEDPETQTVGPLGPTQAVIDRERELGLAVGRQRHEDQRCAGVGHGRSVPTDRP